MAKPAHSVGKERTERSLQEMGLKNTELFAGCTTRCGNAKHSKPRWTLRSLGDIQEDLPESHRMRILICEQNGVPVAGVVASAMGDSAIYLLGATSDDGLNAKGAYLLQWTLIQWLKENGIKWYDLGGIDPGRQPGRLSPSRKDCPAPTCLN